jgi:8-oxo-dGTP diphosphatase
MTEDALRRELREELNIEVSLGRSFHRGTTTVDETRIDLECILGTLTGSRPTRSTDHDLIKWVSPAELGTFDWCAPDVPAVAQLQATAIDLQRKKL